jgi:release factor glutamine methyltransferase
LINSVAGWTQFFKDHQKQLEDNYPGLNLHRFLMEVRDLDQRAREDDFLKGIPFAYLLGWAEFYGRRFVVTPDTLVPRMETELLVEALKGKTFKTALDVGTGTGAILLTLLLEKIIETGTASDISQTALTVAAENAAKFGVTPTFVLSDRFEKIHGKFDLIVSNPPYIKATAHRHLVHSQVATYEPALALYLEDETYDSWFDEFFWGVRSHLNSNGVFLMEGHELELARQRQKLEDFGFHARVLKDLALQDRFVIAELK